MATGTNRKKALWLSNVRLARSRWGDVHRSSVEQLKHLSNGLQLSVATGDTILLNANWHVTHTGLICLAARRRCSGIQVQPISDFSDALNRRYAFKATVYKSQKSPGFVGGGAEPSNVSFLVHGAEIRVAETRAFNRALQRLTE